MFHPLTCLKPGNICQILTLTGAWITFLTQPILDIQRNDLTIYKSHDEYLRIVTNRFPFHAVFTKELHYWGNIYRCQVRSTLGTQLLVQMWTALPFWKALIIPCNFCFKGFAVKQSLKPEKGKKCRLCTKTFLLATKFNTAVVFW